MVYTKIHINQLNLGCHAYATHGICIKIPTATDLPKGRFELDGEYNMLDIIDEIFALSRRMISLEIHEKRSTLGKKSFNITPFSIQYTALYCNCCDIGRLFHYIVTFYLAIL